ARYVGPTTRLPPSAGRGWNRLPETVIANAIVANQCNPSSIKNIDRGGGAAIVIGRTLKPTAVESTPRRPKRGVFKTGILTQSVDLLEWTKGQYGQRHGNTADGIGDVRRIVCVYACDHHVEQAAVGNLQVGE